MEDNTAGQGTASGGPGHADGAPAPEQSPLAADSPSAARASRAAQCMTATESLMADELPDGLVVADDAGRVIIFNRAAARLTSIAAEEAVGKFVSDVLPFRDDDDRDWWVFVDPYHGLATRTRHPERSLYLTDGTELLVSVGYVRDGRGGPVRRLVISLRGAQQRARLERSRAELVSTVAHELRSPLTSRQGVHRHAAGQVAPVHRRPEARHARDGQRRRGPGHAADHRAARRVPHRVGPDGGAPAARRRPRAGPQAHRGPGRGRRPGGQVPPRGRQRPARTPGWTPTRSTRSSATSSKTPSGTGLVSSRSW